MSAFPREAQATIVKALVDLLVMLIGIAGQAIAAYIQNLLGTEMDVDDNAGVVQAIVAGIDRDYPDAPGEEKRTMAFEAAKNHFAVKGIEISTSLINSLLEMAVQRLKKEG